MIVPEQQRAYEAHLRFHASLAMLALPKPPRSDPKAPEPPPAPPLARAIARMQSPKSRDFLWITVPPENIPERKFPEMAAIVLAVSVKYGVSPQDILGDTRRAAVVFPRHVAMYLCRKLTPLSFPFIAQRFNRDHSTIVFAWQKIDARICADPAFAAEVDELARMVD